MKHLRTLTRGVLEGAALLLLIGALQACNGCASAQVQRVGYIGAKDVADLLQAVQGTENGLVCDRPGAPPAPACVPLELHHTIQGYILEAAGYDRQAAGIVRALPQGAPTPLKVMELVSKIYDLVRRFIDALPDGPQKAALAAKVGR